MVLSIEFSTGDNMDPTGMKGTGDFWQGLQMGAEYIAVASLKLMILRT